MGLAEPGEFWAGLSFPDLLRIDPEAREITREQLPPR